MSEALIRRVTSAPFGIGVLSVSVLSLFGIVLSDPASIGWVTSKTPPGISARALAAEPVFGPEDFVIPSDAGLVTVLALDGEFDSLGYQLAAVRGGEAEVPRRFVSTLPEDMAAIDIPAERKRLFIKTTLPLILAVNESILEERARLLSVIAKVKAGEELAAKDRLWLEETTARYEVEADDFDRLLMRIDIVPPSLALAQAAVESGWGTSRFAQEGNALYGERVFAEGAGLVPEDRSPEASHEVRAFPRLIDSVASYVHNLNTHHAYVTFRNKRAAFRASGTEIDGLSLVDWLMPYSEERGGYLKTVRRVIHQNQLWHFDVATLNRDLQLAELHPSLR